MASIGRVWNKSRGYIGMTEQHTYAFVIAVAFNTTCCEAMAESMKLNFWYHDCIKTIKLHHSFDFSRTLVLNYFHFGNSCLS